MPTDQDWREVFKHAPLFELEQRNNSIVNRWARIYENLGLNPNYDPLPL